MLNGYRDCWTYKALNSAHKMELCDFNPNDIRTEDTVDISSSITFTQLQVREALEWMNEGIHLDLDTRPDP